MDMKNTCFVMSRIGSPGSAEHKHADQVFNHIIDPAVSAVGYQAIRADQIADPGHITEQILHCVFGCPLAVADLTGANPNVMYELALRHTTSAPVWQLCSESSSLPFDVGDMRTIKYDLADIDTVTSARHALQHSVEEFAAGCFTYRSPLGNIASASLTDEQAWHIYKLHQGNAAFNMYWVIDQAITERELNPDAYNRETFIAKIESALIESRALCRSFCHDQLGNLYEFFNRQYPELREDVVTGVHILEDDANANLRRTRLLAYLRRRQNEMDVRIEQSLRAARTKK